jgi:hypothetical protein
MPQMIVRITLPDYPHQTWYLGNLAWEDGTLSETHKQSAAKRFSTHVEIGQVMNAFTRRWGHHNYDVIGI